MKKLLAILGASALTVTGVSTVTACKSCKTETTEENSIKEIHWDLNAYNNKPESQPNQIWIDKKVFDNVKNDKNKFKEFIQVSLWTGMFDADDKDGSHYRQLKRFIEQKVSDKLIISENDINSLKDFINNGTKTISNFTLKLTENVNSMTTDTENPKDVKEYTLIKSETTIKEIKINYVEPK